jgi:hypothetical protein
MGKVHQITILFLDMLRHPLTIRAPPSMGYHPRPRPGDLSLAQLAPTCSDRELKAAEMPDRAEKVWVRAGAMAEGAALPEADVPGASPPRLPPVGK